MADPRSLMDPVRPAHEVLLLTQIRHVLEGAEERPVRTRDGKNHVSSMVIRADRAELAHLLVQLDALLRGAR